MIIGFITAMWFMSILWGIDNNRRKLPDLHLDRTIASMIFFGSTGALIGAAVEYAAS